jgi:hypothetical protein
MEKSYRDLFDALQAHAEAAPALRELIAAVEAVDDMDPLRIAALKAMKKNPVPPINVGYAIEHEMLVMYARNTVRKRKASRPARCAQIPAFAWLFEAEHPFPAVEPELRARYVELVQRSFGYLETRIANYFVVGHDSELVTRTNGLPVLAIETRGADRATAAP